MGRKTASSRSATPRFRLLPLFILAGALMFGARLGSLWQRGTGHAPVTPAAVVEQPLIAPALAQGATPEAKPAAEPLSGMSEPAGFSQSEIEVLQSLAARREELDRRERELDQRLAVLSAAEAQIDAKIQKLREIQKTIEGLLDKHQEQEDKKIESLVKIYQAMKPKDAARIFEQMDMPILIRVFKGMKERTSAAILAEMTPDRANAVTAELATQTQLPPDLAGDAGVKR
ncbi:MotE family protein [Oleispirillum naphthae]|uniref:MotE family protein n=1 Tax=Oleispirillum naphthae TaxID=2838853 RepID=UPI00308223C4